MATGTEIWFGYMYPEYHVKAPPDAPRMPWPIPNDGSEDGWSEEWREAMGLYSHNATVVQEAWMCAMNRIGLKPGTPKERDFFPVYVAENKERYDFVPFKLEYELGGEMGWAFPDVPIGVALSSRYFPTFLDYRSSSGTLPNPIIIWEEETKKLIDIAVEEIVKAVPWLKSGKLMVLEIHY